MKLFSFFIFLFIIGKVASNDLPFYNHSFLGEKTRDHYDGPLSPTFHFDKVQNRHVLDDDKFQDNLFLDLTADKFKEIEYLWFKEIPVGSYCPNFFINENIEYIRYLFRLVSVSYLFESVKKNARLSYKLGLKENTCTLNWNLIFGQCDPKTADMKTFLRRAKHRYLIDFELRTTGQLFGKDIEKWIQEFNSKPFVKTIDEYRLKNYCMKNKCSDIDDIKTGIMKTCEMDRKYIKTFCSEDDSYLGLSYLKDHLDILLKSNVMSVINKGGFGENCLKRYVSLMGNKERKDKYLSRLYELLKNELLQRGDSNIQGELFLPGALKEFDDKGLADLLYVPPVPSPTPEPVVVVAPKPTPVPTPVPTAVPTPVVVKVIPTPVPTPVPTPMPTEFSLAYHRMVDKNKKTEDIDMKKFKSDFIFSERMKKALDGPLVDYQTRSALEDMKKIDKLGSLKEPMRLIFLKYLIDHDKHQGLWNITYVIGEEFYVFNDIDKNHKPVLIRLFNNRESKNKWQIRLLNKKKAE